MATSRTRMRQAAWRVPGARSAWQLIRHLGIDNSQVTYLVSYPKSGSTWVRFMLYSLIVGEAASEFDDVRRAIPYPGRLRFRQLRAKLGDKAQPRMMKSHEARTSIAGSRYKRAVLLVRDPRDVAVSYYHYLGRRGRSIPRSGYLDRFLAGLDGLPAWGVHTRSWIDARAMDLTVVRYEDLKTSPMETLGKMAEFLGLNLGDDALAAAIGAASFDTMRKMERRSLSESNDEGRTPFVRSGRSGQWRTFFDASEVLRITAEFGEVMRRLGYECDVQGARTH